MLALLGRILNVRREEWRRIFFLSAIIFTFILGITWAQIVIPAAFLEQVGVGLLPYIFIGDAIAVIITMMVYSAFADRYSHDRVMIGLISIGVTAILFGRVLLALNLIGTAYLYLYILFRMLTEGIGLHLGTYVNSFYDTQSAKRIIPILFSVLRLAVIVAGFTVPLLNAALAPENIILLWALMLVCMAGLVILMPRIMRDARRSAAKSDAGAPSHIENIKEGFKFVLESNYLRAMAAASLLLMIVFTILNFESLRIFESVLKTTKNISNFTGTLTAIGSLIILPVQLFLYSRIVARVGVGNTNLIFPFTTAGVSLLVIAFPAQLWAGGLANFNISTLNVAFRAITDDLLYNAVPSRVKGRARAFIGGIVVPMGTLVAGVLTLLPITNESWFLPVVLGGFAAAYLLAAFVVRRMYGRALIKLLQTENTLLLSAADFNLQDAATVNFLKQKLQESTDTDAIVITARLIAEGLGKDAVPVLEPYARTGEADMRAAILDTLVECNVRGDAVRRLYTEALADPSYRVRRTAITGLEHVVTPRDPEYLALAAKLLENANGDDPEVTGLQAHVIAALLRSNDSRYHDAADAALHRFLDSEDAGQRAVGVNILMSVQSAAYVPTLLTYLRDSSDTVRIAAATALEALTSTPEGKAALAQHVAAIERMLNDVVERVRLAGVRILAALDAQSHLPLLVRALTDGSRGVRGAAVSIVADLGKSAVPELKGLLNTRDPQKRKMATYALCRIDRDDYVAAINDQIRQHVSEIYENHARLAALEAQAKYTGITILQNAIQDRIQESAADIFYLLSAIYPTEAVNLVKTSLISDTESTRASAIEALETMIPPTIVPPIAALFDPAKPNLLDIGAATFEIKPVGAEAILNGLLNDEEASFRAITAFALGEMGAAVRSAEPSNSVTQRSRRRPALDLLSVISDDAPKEETPPAPAPKTNGLFSYDQIQTMLDAHAGDVEEDVRTAVAAARRVLEGSSIIEAARKEGNVLSAIEKVIFLKGVPFFQGMTIEQLKVLANVCEEQLFPESTVIYEEGEPGGTLYVIVSGKVAIERRNRVTRTTARLGTVDSRSYFGEATLFDNSATTTMALALEDTLTLRLRNEHLVALMQEYPELSLHLIKILSKRLQETSEQVASLTRSMSRSMHQVYDKLD